MAHREKISEYYDYMLPFYKVFWHGDTRALHYGIWDEKTKSLSEALLNTNKVLADVAGVRSGEQVLDAGCGVGGSAFWLARNRGVHVVGITLSEKQLAKAHELAARYGLTGQTEFHLQDYTKTIFPTASFDLVWAIESVCHAVRKEDFLREAYRLLKPGGRVIVADGFLERKPDNTQERQALQDFIRGLALDNLAYSNEFERSMRAVDFTDIQNINKTAAILPTSKKLARMSRWSHPLSKVTTWLRLTPQLLVDNNKAGIQQLQLVKDGVMAYRIFVGVK